jgi:hypothetical protein
MTRAATGVLSEPHMKADFYGAQAFHASWRFLYLITFVFADRCKL